MPVNTPHPQFTAHLDQWQRCRDAVGGSDAVKARGTAYLPKLGGQTDEEYKAYVMRTLWYGASARTVQGLTGLVMRKDPVVEVPKALEEHLKDVTLTGISFPAFAKTTLEEVLKAGRYGVLVDMPKEGSDVQRPKYAAYIGEAIVNWQTVVVNGIHVLTMVVLWECVWQEKPEDRYVLEAVEQYRVLRINSAQQYEQEIYQQDPNDKDKWISKEKIVPMFRQKPFAYIPFCFFGPNTITPEIEKPPILDLVDVNLSHYRTSADLEHGAHFCGLPTPVVSGVSDTTKELKIGSATAWILTDPNARASMLEFTGQGLTALEARLEKKEKLMAVLGARLLEEQKKTVEAADTLTMRYAGEQSVLRSVAGTVSTGLSKLLEWAAIWSGVSPEEAKKATAKLNTDFMDTSMTFAELEALVRTWQAGAISYETMYYNMERGEVTRPGIDWQKEKAQIEAETPAAIPQNEPDLDEAGVGA